LASSKKEKDKQEEKIISTQCIEEKSIPAMDHAQS